MSNPFGTERWCIELPKGWLGEWEDEIAAVYHPNGAGTLQISGYQKETEVTDEDLLEFIEEDSKGPAVPFAATGFVGYQISYVDGTSHWETWFLRNADLMLFVTYNCNVADSEFEKEIVLAAVRSITPRL